MTPQSRARSRQQPVPLPAHHAIDHVTAALLEVQRLRRTSALDAGLGESLARLETELRAAAAALYDVTDMPASWRSV